MAHMLLKSCASIGARVSRSQVAPRLAVRSFQGTAVLPVRRQVTSHLARGFAVQAKSVAVNDKLPSDAKFSYFDGDGNMQEVSTSDLFKGKKVVLIGIPGAFTPTCSTKHLPGFIEKVDEFKSKGVDTIACTSVNDPFVMDAWGKSAGTDGKILLLADGSATFAKAIGVDLDLSDKGLGLRSRRYTMLIDDGVVKELNLEEGGAFTVSSADALLKAL